MGTKQGTFYKNIPRGLYILINELIQAKTEIICYAKFDTNR